MDPGPHLLAIRIEKMKERMLLLKTYLEAPDVVQCASCGTSFDDAFWDRDVGALWLILMPLKTRP